MLSPFRHAVVWNHTVWDSLGTAGLGGPQSVRAGLAPFLKFKTGSMGVEPEASWGVFDRLLRAVVC